MEFLIPARRERPADDPIFALNAEASARRARGEVIVNATVGALLCDDGALAVLPSVVEALREVPAVQAAGYAPLAGPPAFNAAVIDDLLGGSALAEHAVAVATPGGTGALRHAMVSFLEPAEAILTTSFYWGPYLTIAEENDRRVETFPMFAADGELDVDSLGAGIERQLETQGRALLLLNDPCQNPTGYSMGEPQWRGVVDRLSQASKRGPITLVVDVAYFLYGAADSRRFVRFLEPLLGKVNLCFAWTGSKSFTQYGARIGALVLVDPDPVRRARARDALCFACRGVWSNCNHAGLLAITRILRDPPLRARVDGERAALRRVLDGRVRAFNEAARATTLRFPRYDGGFFSTVFVPPSATADDAAAELRGRGVYVVPQGEGLRVGLCSVPERDVPRLVEALSAALPR